MNFRSKIFLTLLFCLQCFFGFAQVKKQCGNVACDSFRVFREDKKLKLPSLLKSKDSLHFRYYTNCNVVDIWSKDGVSFGGMVTAFTNPYPEYNDPPNKRKHHRKSSKYIFRKEPIDSIVAEKVYNLSLGMQAIPTGDSIKEWEIGEDGETFVFQTATPSCICMKWYWSPDAQRKTLSVAKTVDSVNRGIDTLLNFEKRFDNFSKQLKPGTYHNGLRVVIKNRMKRKMSTVRM